MPGAFEPPSVAHTLLRVVCRLAAPLALALACAMGQGAVAAAPTPATAPLASAPIAMTDILARADED